MANPNVTTEFGTYHLADNPAQYQPVRTNNFRFIAQGLDRLLRVGGNENDSDDYITNGTEIIDFSVVSFEVPHFSQTPIEISRGNSKVKYAGVPSFSTGNLVINAQDGSNGSCIGGLVANVKDSELEVVDCDVTIGIVGTGNVDSQQFGGVVGYLQQDSKKPSISIKDSVFVVTMSNVGKTAGGLVGYVQTKGTATNNDEAHKTSLNINNVTVTATIDILNTGGVRTAGIIGGIKSKAELIDVSIKETKAIVNFTSKSGRVAGIIGSDESPAGTITIALENVSVTGTIVAEKNDRLKAFVVEGNNTFNYTNCYYSNLTITGAGTAVAIDQGTEKTA